MVIHFPEDILLGYLRYTFPGKYVVVVNMEFEDNGMQTEKTKYALGILTDLDSKKISEYGLEEMIFVVCETKEEAYTIYEKFPEEKAPYTSVFGQLHIESLMNYRKVVNITDKQFNDGIMLHENT